MYEFMCVCVCDDDDSEPGNEAWRESNKRMASRKQKLLAAAQATEVQVCV